VRSMKTYLLYSRKRKINSYCLGEGKRMPTDVPWTILARALESSHEISLKEESRQMCDCLLGSKKVKLVLSVVTCFLKIFFIS
jgi:hypothetical protein